MFRCKESFKRRENDIKISKNFFSESEKNLKELNFNVKYLRHSDSNILGSCGKFSSRKRDRWRSKSQVGYQYSSISGKDSKSDKSVKRNNKRRNSEGTVTGSTAFYELFTQRTITAYEKKSNPEECETLKTSSMNLFLTNGLDFIDESKNESQEIAQSDGSTTDDPSHFNTDTRHSKSDNICLMNQKSIISLKVINNNSNDGDKFTKKVNEKELLRSFEPEYKLNEQNGSQMIFSVSSDFDANNKSHSGSDTDLLKSCNKNLKNQKSNSKSSFFSFCSFFNSSKLPIEDTDTIFFSNNKTDISEQGCSKIIHKDIVTANLSCCPLSTHKTKYVPGEMSEKKMPQTVSKIAIINKCPKRNYKALFPDADRFSKHNKDSSFPDSSSSEICSNVIAPMASPEAISPAESLHSFPSLSDHSSDKSTNLIRESNFFASMKYSGVQVKLKLIREGDVQVSYVSHSKTIFNKVLSSKLLRRWETHHVYLSDDCLCSKTSTGFLESPVPYSNIDEIYAVGRWDQKNRFCVRVVMAEGSLLLQTSNALARDQWLSSIIWKRNMHKYRNILQTSTRPEVIIKEIRGLISTALDSPFKDDSITNVPIEIISKELNENEIWSDRQRSEEVIVALSPLLENSTPSPEMFRFFSRHCLSHPRSPVVAEIFTPVAQRILKRTMDFGKSPLMRRFVTDYLKALHSQNDGDKAVRKFVLSIHGTSSSCPHPRVLPNLVAVTLAAVFSHFEKRKMLLTESANETNFDEALKLLDKQLECFITVFLTISDFEDWRPGLAQFLQPIPFPDDALSHTAFMEGFTPVIRKIGMDPRCEVHETILGIRENKEGWLNIFCPSSLACKDEGTLWCLMLQKLFHCCCRRKSFLQKLMKHFGALLLVALRSQEIAQEILCLMLEWNLLDRKDQELQILTTLQSTETGRQKYNELCKRQERLKKLQKEGGPKKLTFPSRSTDADVAQLFSCGSFGNLECLSLAFTHVTSACAHQLIQLPSLKYLNLWATQFGDAGLVIIAEHLDKLQVLNLCETPVSDKGIAAIAAMRSLKKLNLNSTKLSPQTLDTLKLKLPTLQELDVRYTDAW